MNTLSKFFSKHLLLIVIAGLVSCGDNLTDIEHVQRAKDFQDKGDLVSAIIELKNAASKAPANTEARLILGRIYLAHGDPQSAEKELKKAIDLGVNDTSVQLDYYRSLLQLGKYDEILSQLQIGDYNKPEEKARAMAIVGNIYLEQNKISEAKSFLDKSIRIQRNPGAIAGLIKWYLINGDTDSAYKYVRAGLADFSNNYEVNLIAADYFRYIDKLERAIELYSRALSIIEHSIAALLMRAELYVIQGKEELAVKDLDHVLVLDKNNSLANFIQAKIKFGKNDFTGAKTDLERVLVALPNHPQTLALSGVVEYQLGNYEQAASKLEKYRASQFRNADIDRLLADTYIKLGRGESAITVLEDLQGEKAKDPMVSLLLGTAYMQNDNLSASKKILESAQVHHPENSALVTELASLQILLGESDQAQQNLEAVLKGEDVNVRAQILLLWAYTLGEQYNKALSLINNLIREDPKDPKKIFVRGLIQKQKGDLNASEMDFKKALSIDDKYHMAMVGLAELAIQEEKYDEAETQFKKVLAVKKDHLGSLLGMSLLEKHRGNEQAMFDWLVKARTLRPEMNQPVEAMASLLVRRAEFEKAESLAIEYMRAYPDSPEALGVCASIFLAVKNYTEAEFVLRRYLNMRPADRLRRMQLIDTLRLQSDFNAALQEIAFLPQHEVNPYLQALKVQMLIDSDRVEEAKEVIENLSRTEDNSALYHSLRGDLFFKGQQLSQAAEYYELAYQASPKFTVLKRLVQLDILRRDMTSATKRMERHLERNEKDHNARLLLAALHDHRGKLKDAIAEYELILLHQPKNVTALNNLALLFLKQNKTEKARARAETAYKLFPSAEVMDTYGWVLVNAGKEKKAIELLELALSRLPENQEIMYHLAYTLAKIGEKEESKRVARKITDKKYARLLSGG